MNQKRYENVWLTPAVIFEAFPYPLMPAQLTIWSKNAITYKIVNTPVLISSCWIKRRVTWILAFHYEWNLFFFSSHSNETKQIWNTYWFISIRLHAQNGTKWCRQRYYHHIIYGQNNIFLDGLGIYFRFRTTKY